MTVRTVMLAALLLPATIGVVGTESTDARSPSFDIAAVIETVQHAVRRADGGDLVANDDQYRARFDPKGFGVELVGGPALRIRARAAGRRILPVAPGAWRGDRNVARRTLLPGVEERVTARRGELEWDVVLGDEPAGAGAFVVRASVSRSGAVPTRRGLHWGFGGGRSLLMGDLVVRDRTGVVHRARPTLVGTSLELRVPAPVLERAEYPLVLDPVLTPDYAVADPAYASARYGTATHDQTKPALAFDGTNYLLVWEQRRPGGWWDAAKGSGPRHAAGQSDVFAARVGADGELIDATSIPVATTADEEVAPAVSWNGSSFLVVWENRTNGDVHGARVLPNGTVAGTTFAILPGSTRQGDPAVAWNGVQHLVAWTDHAVDIRGARVTSGGDILGDSIPISVNARTQRLPAVAAETGRFLVAWEDDRTLENGWDIYAARVDGDGFASDPAGIPVTTAAGHQQDATVAAGGGGFLVAWESSAFDDAGVFARRVTTGGALPDAAPLRLSVPEYTHVDPAAAWSGAAYLVAWTRNTSDIAVGVYARRVDPEGNVLDDSMIAVGTGSDQSSPAVASDGTRIFAVWQDHRDADVGDSYDDWDLWGTRVDGAAVTDPEPLPLSRTKRAERLPVVASDGEAYLVVWQAGDADGPTDVHAARVTATGVLVDKDPIVVTAAPGDQRRPVVCWNGSTYLVAWEDRRSDPDGDVSGARISSRGDVLDPGGIALAATAAGETRPVLAWDGELHLLAWTERGDIRARRLGPSGAVLDAIPLEISSAAGEEAAPAVASNGSGFLVAWEDRRDGEPDVYGARVGADGSLPDPAGIALASAPTEELAPALASDGERYLLTWNRKEHDPFFGRPLFSAVGSIVGPGTAPGESFVLERGARAKSAASIAWNGRLYRAVWQLDGNHLGTTQFGAGSAAIPPDGYGSGVSPAARPLGEAGWDRERPAVAALDRGFLAVWGDHRAVSRHDTDVYATRLHASGVEYGRSFPLTVRRAGQSQPAVAFDGTNFLVVWEDDRLSAQTVGDSTIGDVVGPASTDVWGARVTPSGELLDAAGIEIAYGAGDQYDPAVTWGGDHYLVVWLDDAGGLLRNGGRVQAARVGRDGVVKEPYRPIEVGVGRAPDVAWDGTAWLVAWDQSFFRNVGGRFMFDADVRAQRVGPTGTLAGAPFAISGVPGSDQRQPTLAAGPAGVLAAWNDARGGVVDVYGARISEGAVADPAGIRIGADSEGTGPDAAAGAGRWLVVWVSGGDVAGARVSGAGTVEDDRTLSVPGSADGQRSPQTVWSGRSFVVAWSETTNLYGTQVAPTGEVANDKFPIGSAIDDDATASLVALGGDRVAVGFQRAARAILRVLTDDFIPAAPAPPEAPAPPSSSAPAAVPDGGRASAATRTELAARVSLVTRRRGLTWRLAVLRRLRYPE